MSDNRMQNVSNDGKSLTSDEQVAVYDLLLSLLVKDPAVLSLGEVCVAGRWEEIGEVRVPDVGHARGTGASQQVIHPQEEGKDVRVVCRAGKVGVVVLAEGATWNEVSEKLQRRFGICFGTVEKRANGEKQGSNYSPTAEKAEEK